MPQGSIYYAVGRLSVLEKTALDSARLERLLHARDLAEARRVLAEVGFREDVHFEQAAEEHLMNACHLVRELATDPKLVDAFLVRHDIANLKILLKARALGQEPEALSLCGIFPVDTLRHAVDEHMYDKLGDVLKAGLDALEKRLAIKSDPMDIDVSLDKMHYAYVFDLLGKKKGTALTYFRTRVDLTNFSMALRAAHGEKPQSFLAGLLIDGGSVPPKTWLAEYARPERLPLQMQKYGPSLYASAVAAYMNADKLATFERDADDHLLQLFMPFRRSIDRDERLIGHLLMRQRESAAVRLVMAGKENRFPEDIIRERLRGLYG